MASPLNVGISPKLNLLKYRKMASPLNVHGYLPKIKLEIWSPLNERISPKLTKNYSKHFVYVLINAVTI